MRNSKSSLKNIRVLRKNMLFIQSYDEQLNKSVLQDQTLYEICGEVEKIKVKENYKNHTAYVTYRTPQAAATAFIALYQINQRMKILFGTVQYCKYFTRKSECRNDQCVFLHLRDKKNEIVVEDQIDEETYDDHYDMAVSIAEDEAFETMRQVLSKKEENCQNILKKGIRKAADLFNITTESKLEVSTNASQRKSSELQESLGSTTEESLTECREEPFTAERSSSQKQLKSKEGVLAPIEAPPQITPQPTKILVNSQRKQSDCSPESKNKQKKEKDFSLGEYISIQLVKKLIRENKSKMHLTEESSREHIHKRGNMMLYKIVKK